MRFSALALVLFAVAAVEATAAAPQWMMEAEIRGRKIEGAPLSWSDDEVHLLARDGYLWQFRPDEARNFRKTAGNFRSYSAGQLRAALEGELGGKLETTGTGHYLVAHPPGQGGVWAERFENLYRSFAHDFAVRGLSIKEPQFPLVAIVWGRHEDFVRHSMLEGFRPSSGVLGYYSPQSNRVNLFDSSGGGKGEDWKQNAATIIHEATHQTAFNTGVHSRFALPPRWLAEGLGTLYEAPGIWDARSYPNQSQRINRGRFDQFNQMVRSGRPAGLFVELISSDDLFASNPGAAYAEAWALTFYLSETEPRKYCQYLAKTAARPAFADYSRAQRLADFTAVFGNGLRMLDANLLRFIGGLK